MTDAKKEAKLRQALRLLDRLSAIPLDDLLRLSYGANSDVAALKYKTERRLETLRDIRRAQEGPAR